MKKVTSGILTRIRNITRPNKTFVICVLAALVSIAVSLWMRPQFFAPGLINTEWNNATVLRHLQIWDEGGALTYGFNPVVTYPGSSNRHINNNASNEEDRLAYADAQGNYYYTSYPQFAYIAPYLFFKVLFLDPSYEGLRVFALLVQICTALTVAALAYRISRRQSVATVGFVTYMLLPNHLDNYMSDMLVLLFFATTAYLFLKLVTDSKRSNVTLALYALSLFLMVYTEYIGFLVAALVILHALFTRSDPTWRSRIWISVLVPACTILLIVVQYALVSDVQTFLSVMLNRYERSYVRASDFQALSQIIVGYWKWYGPSLVALLGMSGMLWIIAFTMKQKKWLSQQEVRAVCLVLLVFVVPILVHHAGLLQWTAYHALYISLLKSGPLISFCVAIVFWALVYRTQVLRPVSRNVLVAVFLAACAAWCVPAYVYEYRPKLGFELSYCRAGERMSELAGDDTVIFIKDAMLKYHIFPMHPTIVTCARRNMEIYRGESKAQDLMRQNNATEGMIFTLAHFGDEGVEILRTERIQLED